MRNILLFLLFFSVKLGFSQVNDNFLDGNFTANPTWVGNTNLFNVNATKQLQSVLSTTAQTVTLATPNFYATNSKWEFFVQLNFDPSATNQTRIYLLANQQDLNAALNGYFIQIGETGNADSYDLFKQTGTTITKIIDGPAKIRVNANVLLARLRITRDDNGKWELYTDITGGTNYVLEGTTTDNNYTGTAWFGVYCKYTATRSDGFIFDDFSITELLTDVIPPIVINAKVIDNFNIDVTFSEALEPTSALQVNNYTLNNGYNKPAIIAATALPNVFRLTFTTALQTQNYILTVTNVLDKKANAIASNNTATFFFIQPYTALKGDVVINEIFADPNPQIGLPATEYIEIWNTTNKHILLSNWKYTDATTTYVFGTDTIKPNQYIILCANGDVNLFKSFAKTIGLLLWPSLNNSSDVLTLINEQQTIIDKVSYTDDWYKDNVKKQGGYALEQIDAKNICTGIQNWEANKDASGGTPGKQNSVYKTQISTQIPKLLSATIIDKTTIRLVFSKYIDSLTAAVVGNYTINNGIGSPLTALPEGPFFTTVLLKLNTALTDGLSSTLTLQNITDCAGNLISSTANTAILFIAKPIIRNDILISETLFNPKINSVDFIEIYNQTNHILDLKDLQLATTDALGNPTSIKNISAVNLFMLPKSYWVLTTNPLNIKTNYVTLNPNNFVQLTSLPAFNITSGSVILLNGNTIIDQFNYTKKMHLDLLKDAKGVSLERVSFNKDANEVGNFKSAAGVVGFATPTYKNSQQEDINTVKNEVTLVNNTFSPDGDGFEDELQINYSFVNNENLATINIYTDKGFLIRQLVKNQSLATNGLIIWNGLNEAGQSSKVGIYMILFQVFSANGKIQTFKKTCVLAAKLN